MAENKIEVLNPKTLGEEALNEEFEKRWPEIDDMGRRIIKAGDKQFFVRAAHRSGLWEVFSADGGPTPKELRGWFTNIRAAENALAQFASRDSHKGVQARRYSKKLEDAGFFDKE